MTDNPFSDWLGAIEIDNILVDTEDLIAEADANMRAFSLPSEVARTVAVRDVEEFLARVIRMRTLQSEERSLSPGSMLFYCWHDEQAGQLRCSMVSRSHGAFPFRTNLKEVELATVIRSWLRSSYLDGFALEEFAVVDVNDGEELDPAGEFVLPIWSTEL